MVTYSKLSSQCGAALRTSDSTASYRTDSSSTSDKSRSTAGNLGSGLELRHELRAGEQPGQVQLGRRRRLAQGELVGNGPADPAEAADGLAAPLDPAAGAPAEAGAGFGDDPHRPAGGEFVQHRLDGAADLAYVVAADQRQPAALLEFPAASFQKTEPISNSRGVAGAGVLVPPDRLQQPGQQAGAEVRVLLAHRRIHPRQRPRLGSPRAG